MLRAKGFKPSTSWSRNRVARILKALSGVAYEAKEAVFVDRREHGIQPLGQIARLQHDVRDARIADFVLRSYQPLCPRWAVHPRRSCSRQDSEIMCVAARHEVP